MNILHKTCDWLVGSPVLSTYTGARATDVNSSKCREKLKQVTDVVTLPNRIRNAVTEPISRLLAIPFNRLMESTYRGVAEDLASKTVHAVPVVGPIVSLASSLVTDALAIVPLTFGAIGGGVGSLIQGMGSSMEEEAPGYGTRLTNWVTNRKPEKSLFSSIRSSVAGSVSSTGGAVSSVANSSFNAGVSALRSDVNSTLIDRVYLPKVKDYGAKGTAWILRTTVINPLFMYAVYQLTPEMLTSGLEAAFSFASMGGNISTAVTTGYYLMAWGPCGWAATKVACSYLFADHQIEQIHERRDRGFARASHAEREQIEAVARIGEYSAIARAIGEA